MLALCSMFLRLALWVQFKLCSAAFHRFVAFVCRMPPFVPLLVLKDLQRNGHDCFSYDDILEILGWYLGCNDVDKRRVEVSHGRFLVTLLKRAILVAHL